MAGPEHGSEWNPELVRSQFIAELGFAGQIGVEFPTELVVFRPGRSFCRAFRLREFLR